MRPYLLGLLAACGVAAPSAPAAAEPPPLRFFPVAAFDGDWDDILSGVRTSRAVDGAVLVAKERFESGGTPRGVPVPSMLGGGYLFFQPIGSSGSAGTALYRAEEWTGKLRPLGTVPFVVSAVTPGFDRFYLLGAGRAIAVDPEDGSYRTLDPLPPVATILDLAFDASGGAVLRAPLVGMLRSSDSGLSWETLGARGGEPEVPGEAAPTRSLPRQGRLMQTLVSRGGTVLGGVVFGLVAGELVTFDPERGTLARTVEPGLDARAQCQALPPGELADDLPRNLALLWFACQRSGGGLELRAYTAADPGPPGSLVGTSVTLMRQLVFPPGTQVRAAGRLGVLLDGACPDAPQVEGRRLCLVHRDGQKTVLVPAAAGAAGSRMETFAVGGSSLHRVVLLSDGGIMSERLDGPSERTIHRVHREAELEALVLDGTWLPGATVFEEGISFWAVRGESYVGVRLEKDGARARVGAIQRPVRRAFLSGSRALAWGASGFARVSVDGGMTFAEVNYPFVSGDQDPSGVISSEQALELGCGPAGCSLGTWLSVGWGREESVPLQVAPPRIAVPPLGGGRYRFVCAPTGDSSLPGRLFEERLTGGDDAPPSRVPTPDFWERAPPRAAPLEVVHSVGDSRGLARVYATGPKEGPWGARGRVSVFFRSPFQVREHAESLEVSDLFADSTDAQTRLGLLDRMTQSVQTELDPGGRSGVMLIRTRQQTTLLTFTAGGGAERIDVPEEYGLIGLSGVVFSGGRFVIGHVAGGEFRILELTGGQVTLLTSFFLDETGPRDATLTRSTSGDLGITIDGDSGLLVYPVSRLGKLGDPLLQPFRGSRPPLCPSPVAGYFVVKELGISPYVEALGSELDVNRVTLRSIVGFGAECVDAVAADAREAFAPRLLRPGTAQPAGTPFVVTDRSETGRRTLLACQ